MISRRVPFSRRAMLGQAAASAAWSFFGMQGKAAPARAPFPDKDLHPDGSLSYTKALPHNALGAVEQPSFQQLRKAIETRDPSAFERILIGNVTKLANPQAAFSRELDGPDPASISIAAPPLFSSDEQAAEAVELYWKALARDVHFSEYETSPVIAAACKELSTFPGFNGPREQGQVTPRNIFRGHTPGDLAGPYISQFLLADIQYGVYTIPQRLAPPEAGMDYATTFSRWLAVQNGEARVSDPHEPRVRYHLDPGSVYLRNGRDLTELVHRDFSYQVFVNAGLSLLSLKAPLDRGNPYRRSRTQAGFCTFGEAHLMDLVARVTNCALKACWYGKWVTYLRLRPEEYGGKVHLQLTGAVDYPVSRTLKGSEAVQRVYDMYDSYLLPQAYPEGGPTHPAYPAGHATIAGACATVLKAFFDESFELRDPVTASPDGQSLEPCQAPALRVGGELNKLASNIAMGRNFAGIHWRTDATAGLEVGEQVAIAILSNVKQTCNEHPCSFSLTRFDGSTIVI